MKIYYPQDVNLAVQRWMSVTELSTVDFFHWLGFNTFTKFEMTFPQVPLCLGKGTKAKRKMDFLLSDNWYALLKAHEAQNDQ